VIEYQQFIAEYTYALRVLSFYTSLTGEDNIQAAPSMLGGKLLYVGELDEDGRAVIMAGNIAGAASLCATVNEVGQKRALRDGIIDFLVTSLDEALRILKNEVRKHSPVAVCIASPPAEIESQMAERGVVADVPRPEGGAAGSTPEDAALVSWSVSREPARWMPKLDALAAECGAHLGTAARRWLEMAPRYLGRSAQSFHLALADQAFAAQFMQRAMALEGGVIPLKLQFSYRGGCEEYNAPNWDEKRPRPVSA